MNMDRLAQVCKLWGRIKYLHPYLAYRDIDWDAALVNALPEIMASGDAASYAKAVGGMLEVLQDPATRIEHKNTWGEAEPDAPISTSSLSEDGILLVWVNLAIFWTQFDRILERFEEIESQLQDPVVLADIERMLALQREHGGLRKVATSIRDFNKLEQEVNDTKQMIYDESDQEAREYARAELAEIEPKFETLRAELEDILTAGDSMTRGSLIMEIRAGTGGEEAALFARNLFEMYSIFVNTRGWKMEVLEMSDAEMGGIKEVTLSVSGEGCFHQLQFESGGHRVQRVPETESQGRVHTSAATVAVLPEVEDIEVEIRDEDIRMDTMRAGGPGGQKVNKTESAVRLTHIPTNIVVRCQDEKSQHKNRARAMRLLRSKIYEQRQQKLDSDRASARRTLIGSGDRSERIRTYNFPQNRLTDHRIGLTLYKLDRIMQGELDDLISQMLEFDRNERLKGNIEIGS